MPKDSHGYQYTVMDAGIVPRAIFAGAGTYATAAQAKTARDTLDNNLNSTCLRVVAVVPYAGGTRLMTLEEIGLA